MYPSRLRTHQHLLITEKWERTTKECSKELLRILVDFQKSQISNFEELADDTNNKGYHTVIPEFITNIPDCSVASQSLMPGHK